MPGMIDPRQNLRNDMLKFNQLEQFRQMSQEQLKSALKRNEKDKKKRMAMLKALAGGLLGKMKDACTKFISQSEASDISKVGNGMSHGDSAKNR